MRVPVLSLSKYSTLPSYSGIELFLHVVSGISSSLLILYEKYALQKSKLTLKLIGMILESKRTYRKKYKGQRTLISLNTFMMRARMSIKMKRTLERWLIYSSNLPSLVFGSREFICALVYRPVNTTIPIIDPAATTVFAHEVLSRLKDSFFPPEL